MNIDSNIAIVCITQKGKTLACNIRSLMKDGDIYFIQNKKDKNSSEGNRKVIQTSVENNIELYIVNDRLKYLVEEIFDKYEYIVFIMATGIVIRTIAHLVNSKFSDPAILVTDEKGTNIISLLSGHIGGANEMTMHISELLGSNPVITTATDVNKKSSLDMIAKKLDGYIENFRDNVKDVNSMLINNKSVGLYIDGNYDIDTRGFIILNNLNLDDKRYDSIVVVTNKSNLLENNSIQNNRFIKLVPKDIVIGIGCRRNIDIELLHNSLLDLLYNYNIDINSIKDIGSIEIKKDEKAIIELGKLLNVPFKTVSIEEISKIDYLFDKSDWVKKNIGVFSVAEPVAYILSDGNLIIEKQKYKGITFSVGRVKL